MDQDAMEAEYASRVQRVNGPAPACPPLPPRPRPSCCPRVCGQWLTGRARRWGRRGAAGGARADEQVQGNPLGAAGAAGQGAGPRTGPRGEEPGAARQAAGGGRRRWGQDPRRLEGADGGAGRAHREAREAPGGCAAPRPCGAALRPVPAGRAGACSCVVGGAIFRACTTFPSRTNISLWHECCPRSPRRGASQVLRKVADQAEKKLARAARERAVDHTDLREQNEMLMESLEGRQREIRENQVRAPPLRAARAARRPVTTCGFRPRGTVRCAM